MFTYNEPLFITFATKCRQKGMVIILCVCVFANIWYNYENRWLEQATGRPQIIQGTEITIAFC